MREFLKKTTAILMSAIMLTSTMAVSGVVTASAADAGASTGITVDDILSCNDFTYGDFTCRYSGLYGGISIKGCADTVVDAVIPESIEGIVVTEIGYDAFSGNTNLKSVVIPSGVVSLGSYAFENCTNLESVTLPDTLEIIGNSAFEGCTSLSSISIPDSVYMINYGAFMDCTSLVDIKVPDNAVDYRSDIFKNTAWYNSQPDGVVYLGNLLYKYKGTIPENTTLVIKEGTKNIGYEAFYPNNQYVNGQYVDVLQNDNIVEIVMPESLLYIGEDAFGGCDGITSLSFPSNVQVIGTGAFSSCKNLKTIEWPENLKKIESDAFRACSAIESVILPDGVESIGYSSFMNCTSLKTVEMPDSVTTMDPEAFSTCPALESVRLSENLTYIHGYTFEYCKNLKTINIPKKVETIRVWAFYECDSLEEIVLPEGLKTIEAAVFYGCDNLAKINIPSTVEEVRAHAFGNTAWYKSIPDGLVYIGTTLYEYKGSATQTAEVINIKDGTTYITAGAFIGNDYVKKLVIPDSVTVMGNGAFEGCAALEEVKLSKNAPVIPEDLFAYCSSLKSIVLPEGVTTIDYNSFYYCTSLASMYLPKSLNDVDYFLNEYTSPLTDIYYAGSEEELNAIEYHTSLMDILKSKESITFHYNYSVEQPTEAPTEAPTQAPTTPAKPDVENITGEAGLVDAKLSWDAVEGATKYWIFKAWEEDGPFYCYDATTDTNYTVRRLQAATDYYFKVLTVTKKDGKDVLSKLENAPTLHVKTEEAERITVKIDSVSKDSITFSWPEFENAQKYWIKFSNTTKNTNLKEEWITYTSVSSDVTSFTLKNRKPNTPYYITIEVEYPDPQTGKEFANYIPADTKTLYSNENFFTFKKQTNGGLTVTWPADVNSPKSWMYVYDKNGKLVVSNGTTTNSVSFSFKYDWENCTFALKTMDPDSTGRLITPEFGWSYR